MNAIPFGRFIVTLSVMVGMRTVEADQPESRPVPNAAALGCCLTQDFVASDPDGRDTCDGDSGGPAFIDPVAAPSVLIGITSRRVHGSGPSCGPGGVYVRVDADRALWIRSVLDENGLP